MAVKDIKDVMNIIDVTNKRDVFSQRKRDVLDIRNVIDIIDMCSSCVLRWLKGRR